jgi:hypothetical protein
MYHRSPSSRDRDDISSFGRNGFDKAIARPLIWNTMLVNGDYCRPPNRLHDLLGKRVWPEAEEKAEAEAE